VKLSDLIIEHGPWTEGDAAALLTLRATQGRAGRELNELREELIAARTAALNATDSEAVRPRCAICSARVSSEPGPVPVPLGNLSTNSDGLP
jgi:hypothetical protein